MKDADPRTPTRSIGPLTCHEAGRLDLERELLWAIVFAADRGRIEQLERMLTPAANDAFEARVLSGPAADGEPEDRS